MAEGAHNKRKLAWAGGETKGHMLRRIRANHPGASGEEIAARFAKKRERHMKANAAPGTRSWMTGPNTASGVPKKGPPPTNARRIKPVNGRSGSFASMPHGKNRRVT